MLIKTLVEDTTAAEDFGCEHGLSLYIETKANKILFDVGASGLFLRNAEKLDVNIADIDFLIISHGHYDHGGGLKTFFTENTKAKVFMHELAFGKYYAVRANDELEYIGIDENLRRNKRIVPTSDSFLISEGIQIFSDVAQKEPRPKSNRGLLKEHQGELIADTFDHEQNLVVEEEGKFLLITGCAHNGIVNILEHFHSLKGHMPDYVIGGFHLAGHSGGSEDLAVIDRIGGYLLSTKAKFYTGHCTGIEPYQRLKAIMGDRIDYLSTGSVITIFL
ncbi:MAG: MBL fold metallo-hydrolase [Saccharofermentanales bacterium]|nr:MBL fold metallo-hydrolase [Bacillota bacterium]NLB08497.1 MBL fold metallo-hydrolase [Clostridiales bacterium]